MRITLKTGLIFAGIYMVIRLAFYFTGILGQNILPSVMINILCVLLAIAIGLYKQKRSETEPGSMLQDIKNGMTAGVPYAILVAVFLYFFYEKIDPAYNQHQIAEAEALIAKNLDDPKSFAEIKASNPDFEVMTRDQIYDLMVQSPRAVFKASTTMTITMLALLILGTMNSIFVTIVYRKLVFKS